MAFKLSFISDVREVLRGNEAMEKGFDQTADSLEEMARAASKASTSTGRDLKGVGSDADAAADKLERKFRDAFDEVKTSSGKTGAAIGDDIKRGTREAEQGTEDLKRNAASNAKETAASFSGSADDIASGFQQLAAEAFEGFGPAGVIAGAAAAAGLGALWTNIQENTEASRQRVEDMFADFVESGTRMLSSQFINDELSKIYSGADGARISMKHLREASEVTGVTESVLARAYAGDQDARRVAIETVQTALDGVAAAAESTDKRTRDSAQARQADLNEWMSSLRKTESEYESAQERVGKYNDAVNATPKEITTVVNADTGKGVLAIDELQRRAAIPVTTGLGFIVDQQAAQKAADEAARRIVPPAIRFTPTIGNTRAV